MSETPIKYFCSAEIRPKECLLGTNNCCLHCAYVERCTGIIKENNKHSVKKSPLPCTQKIISKDEICEFAC